MLVEKCAITLVIGKAYHLFLATRVGTRAVAGPSICAAILVQQAFEVD
jgi:hypothetical protein